MLRSIPVIDLRGASPTKLLETHGQGAKALVEASKNAFGLWSRAASVVALPVGDAASKAWLNKTNNPYKAEIDAYAQMLGIKGVYALNLCYEWGCTSGAYAHENGVRLMRILDWPFPALGEHVIIALQSGEGGEFYNITWPAVSGVFQALAPKRFAAALNQAPMRRHHTGVVLDWGRNRARAYASNALPPAHLLRKTFETAKNYQEAVHMLSQEPVSIPVIYTLTGTTPSEGCVIERLEAKAHIRPLQAGRVCVANHFESTFNGIGCGWLPRAIDSAGRAEFASSLNTIDNEFRWFAPPIANPLSRLAVVADAEKGTAYVRGTDGVHMLTAGEILGN